mmetsp:Transcript_14723/g.17044  ORF Transcript_14723/g.17044 Transcript_14723/m.17044 type:complete len:96 (-) Transcript_14723:750-1037(-)
MEKLQALFPLIEQIEFNTFRTDLGQLKPIIDVFASAELRPYRIREFILGTFDSKSSTVTKYDSEVYFYREDMPSPKIIRASEITIQNWDGNGLNI